MSVEQYSGHSRESGKSSSLAKFWVPASAGTNGEFRLVAGIKQPPRLDWGAGVRHRPCSLLGAGTPNLPLPPDNKSEGAERRQAQPSQLARSPCGERGASRRSTRLRPRATPGLFCGSRRRFSATGTGPRPALPGTTPWRLLAAAGQSQPSEQPRSAVVTPHGRGPGTSRAHGCEPCARAPHRPEGSAGWRRQKSTTRRAISVTRSRHYRLRSHNILRPAKSRRLQNRLPMRCGMQVAISRQQILSTLCE